MAILKPTFPAASGEKLQYMSHTMNDSSVRFLLHYPGRVELPVLRRALRHLVDRVFVLHSSFTPADDPYWVVNDGYTNADMVRHIPLPPGGDVLAAAEKEALRPVRFEDQIQLHCTLADNGAESAIALVVSHLIADGGDAKYILCKLVELYNCILNGGEPDDVSIKNGDRDLLQIFDNVTPEALEMAEKAVKEEKAEKSRQRPNSEFPFPEAENVGRPRILRRTISAEALAPARRKAKAAGSTVNDLLLAAYYRAAVEIIGMAPTAPISILSMMDLRQYMIGGHSEGICNLSGPLASTLPNGVGEHFADTLAEVTAQTQAAKGNGLMGMQKQHMDLGRRVVRGVFSIPFRMLAFAGKMGTRNMPMGMTNLGNMRSADLTLGALAPDFGYFAGQIKRKPGIQLAVMSLDGAPTLTISNICGAQDAAALEQLLELVEAEVMAYGREV